MQVRLAFSVMIEVDAEILLIDEVLAVGDAAFQQKCFDVFYRMRDEGRTILLVTHDMGAVERFCHRALLLEHGRGRELDEPAGGGASATWSSTSATPRSRRTSSELGRERARGRRGRDRRGVVRGRARASAPTRSCRASRARSARACEFDGRGRGSRARRGLRRRGRASVFGDVDAVGRGTRRAASGRATRRRCRVTLRRGLRPGPRLRDAGGRRARQRATSCSTARGRLASVVVTGTHRLGGLVMLPHDVGFERVDGRSAGMRGRRRERAAGARPRRARHADPRAVRARRRRAPLLQPHPDARGHRVQAAVLRLGARLRVAAACAR